MKLRISQKDFANDCLWKQLFASNSSQIPSNIVSLKMLLTLRLFTQFWPKIRAIKLQKRARLSLTWKLFSRSFGLYQWIFLVPYLATSGNTQCWKNLFWHPVFSTTWELCLPVLNFQLTQASHLVPNIPIWGTDVCSLLLQRNNWSLSFILTCLKTQSSECIFPVVKYFFIYLYQGEIKLVPVFQN